jgi:hypothetical protein
MYRSSTSLDVGQSTTSACSGRFSLLHAQDTCGRYLGRKEESQSAADGSWPFSGSSTTPAYLIDQLVFDRVIRQVGIVFHPHFFEYAGSIRADGLY